MFGKASGHKASIDVASLDGNNGFAINGAAVGGESGYSVASAGDVNGDGFADLIIGAPYSGTSYVVLGKASGFAVSVDLSSLDGSSGFKLSGVAPDDRSGSSVASAGDVNGDGFADLIVGAREADPHGTASGASYVVFGKTSGFAANIDLSNLDGSDGFRLSGAEPGDYSGYSVASAGDVNGDGFADLIVGAHEPNPPDGNSGSSYVIFGRAPDTPVNRVGTGASQTLAGGAFDDNLSGLGGNDALYGNGGNDTLDGGSGIDEASYAAATAAVTVSLTIATAQDTGGAGSDTLNRIENLTGSRFADSLTGNDLANVLDGGAGNDTLHGGAGNDTLDGGRGADTMNGGDGDDLYVVDSAGDVIVPDAGGIDTAKASLSFKLPGTLENLTLIGQGNINGTGNASNNVIDGNSGDNLLSGLGADDTLSGNDGNDTLDGGGGEDTLNGGSGHDTLDGGADADAMDGGIGDDLYIVDNVGDAVADAGGVDSVQSSVSFILAAMLENLTLSGARDLDGTGNAKNNILTGNSGNNLLIGLDGDDTLDGGAGADRMDGGSGNDLYIVDETGDIIEPDSGGVDTVRASISHKLSATLEHLTLIGPSAINGTGNANNNVISGNSGNNLLSGLHGDDTLDGGAGNDTLDGGRGADTMNGGDGDDLYVVDNTGDVVVRDAGGIDTARASLSFMLPGTLENLTLIGHGNINGTGNASNNVIDGNSGDNLLSGLGADDTLNGDDGNDTLDGGGGEDTLNGGSGHDTLDGGADADAMDGGIGDDLYIVDNVGDVVADAGGLDSVQSSVSFILAAMLENLTLSGARDLDGTGNAKNNILTGNSGNNLLIGLAGNDTLDGGTGADAMDGGSGNDRYIVDNVGDVVVADSGGLDTVQSSVSFTLAAVVENLTLTGRADIAGAGNGKANAIVGNGGDNVLSGLGGNDTLDGGTHTDRLFGGAGNDTLDGGLGKDIMDGGDGDDLYIVDHVGDVAREHAGPNGGVDAVHSSVTFTLSRNVENLTLTGVADIDRVVELVATAATMCCRARAATTSWSAAAAATPSGSTRR